MVSSGSIQNSVVATAFSFVAACGGGGQPMATDPDQIPSTKAAEMQLSVDTLLEQFTNPIHYTELTAIPTRDEVSYSGYLYGSVTGSADNPLISLIGDMHLDVLFLANGADITGTASNFFDSNSTPLPGTIRVSDVVLDRSGNPNSDATIVGLVGGDLTLQNGDALSLAAQLEGDFLGSAVDAIGGAVLGNTTIGQSVFSFDGGFILSR